MSKKENRRADIMQSAIDLVADNGMAALTTRQIARRTNVSEALMYRFFDSKEDLLAACLYLIADRLSENFQIDPADHRTSGKDPIQIFRTCWENYFSYLLENSRDTLFFYEFSQSPNLRELVEEGKFSVSHFYYHIQNKLGASCPALISLCEQDVSYFWCYFFNVSTIFAVKMIRKEFPDSPESREKIWSLLFQGISAFAPE